MSGGRHRRVQPVTDTADPALAELLQTGVQSSGLGAVPDFHGVLAQHPDVLRRIVGAGLGRMPDGALSVRQRELLVLRTARRCNAVYEWAHHSRRAAERGLRQTDLQLAWDGPDDVPPHRPGDPATVDRLLLQVADALHDRDTLDDSEWRSLEAAVGTRGAIEAVVVVGWFHLIAFLGNALGFQVEPGVDPTFGPRCTTS